MHVRSVGYSRFVPLFLLLMVFVVATGPRLHAQALETASKRGAISAFAGYSYANPEYTYSTPPSTNTGFSGGLDLTRYLFRHVAPSLEFRGTYHSGPEVSEHTGLAGIKVQTTLAERYHPYVNFLAGAGVIKFLAAGPGLHSDRSTVYSYGGGVDIAVIHRVAVMADIQEQHWDLGHIQMNHQTFSPYIATVGLMYRIPFRVYNRQADLR